jgi:hypothetical protein
VAAGAGVATKAIAGAAATATANPPAMIIRRAGNFMVAIVTLSVDSLKGLVGAIVWKLNGICMRSQSFLSISLRRFLQAKRTK